MSGLAIQWLILFVDFSVKSTLVALIAAIGLALLRVRNSNLRHRVWTGVLCGMLLLPALTQVVPALCLPFAINPEWFTSMNRVETSEQDQIVPVDVPPVVASDEEPASERAGQDSLANLEASMSAQFDWQDSRRRWPQGFPGDRPGLQGSTGDVPPRGKESILNAPLVDTKVFEEPAVAPKAALRVVRTSFFQRLLAQTPLFLMSLWLAGLLVLTLRLLAGLWMANRLKCASQPIDPDELPGVRNGVPILNCPLIRVPLTLGVIRPRILLPDDWSDWSVDKLDAVLVHERTHAERGDCILALLAELNRCLYWFHPLAWWLRSKLASLAETACDDAAIDLTGDRAGYALHLLEVAATARTHRGRLVSGSVSMARCSNVESRINAILDFTRPLSQRLTRATALVLMAIIVPLIGFAAALRPLTSADEGPNPEAVAANPNQESSPAEQSNVQSQSADPGEKPERTAIGPNEGEVSKTGSTTAGRTADDDSYAFVGSVADEYGQPVAGAKITLSYFQTNPIAGDAQTRALSDERGQFQFSLKQSDLSDVVADGLWFKTRLVAAKDGFGFASVPAHYFERSGQ